MGQHSIVHCGSRILLHQLIELVQWVAERSIISQEIEFSKLNSPGWAEWYESNLGVVDESVKETVLVEQEDFLY